MRVMTLAAFFILLSAVSSLGEDWIRVRGDNYVDKDSISCEEHICRAWTLLSADISGKKGLKKFEIYDCREKKVSLLQAIDYDEDGKVQSNRPYTSNIRWDYILPETIADKKAAIICGQRKETVK